MAETQNKEFVYFGPRKIAVWPDELKLFPVEPASDNITIRAPLRIGELPEDIV